MPAHSSLKASDSHNTLRSSIVPSSFSALSLKLDATRHSFHHNTQHPHPESRATAATLHHSQRINPESDTWRFLDSMPAIQRYKIPPQRDIIHEVPGLNGVGCWRSQNSMADSSTTTAPILDLIAGDYWARHQLHSGIKNVSVASKPKKSLTLMRVVFIDTLAMSELDGRFLHNHSPDPESDRGRSSGSMPATQRYKGRLCRIRTQEVADPCESCLYKYAGDLRARWQIPPQPLDGFCCSLREVVGLDASYAAV